MARLEFPRKTGLILRCAGKAGSLWLQPHSVPGELQVGSSGSLRGPGLAQASGHSLAGPEEPAACESVLAGEQRAGRVGFSPPQLQVNASSGHSLRALIPHAPSPEARGGGWEELPHFQGSVAVLMVLREAVTR